MGKKFTWWQFQKRDYIWLILFAAGCISLATVLVLHFFIEPFYSMSGFVVSLTIPVSMIAGIGYVVFYKDWRRYLKEYEDK